MRMTAGRALIAFAAFTALSGAASSAELTIVAVHSQTGPIAFLGVPVIQAARMAVDELNAKKYLGEDTIKLVVYDDATRTAETQTLINKAALQDNALMILGPSDSTRAVAVAPMINELKIPALSTAQTDASLKAGPWMFKITTNPTGAVAPLADYAVQKLNLKRVAAVHYRDNDGQIANMRTFMDGIKKGGSEVIAEESVLSSDSDYTAVATKIASLKPDGVYLGANAEQAANIAVALKNAGVDPNIKFFGTSSLGEDYIKQGGAAVDNTYMTMDYNPQSKTPLNVAFTEAFKKRYNVDATNYAGVGYDSVMVAAAAIKNASPNPTREKVRDALARLKDVPVVIGSGSWTNTESRVPEYGIQVAVIKNGKIVAAD